ncbi:MAG: helix-turn-helix domain-containing protein [Nitrospirales bacterium]|nr:helix-turn-helix domain-containing protein [Nitrospirales bacterium]NKB82838.1 helix-turn-helix domain-containing protein [Nitrospirales bacterium]
MATEKKYKSEAMEAIHQTMEGLYASGLVNKKTMRKFDQSCLEAIPSYSGADIKKIREREDVSQPVFALYIGVSRNLVSDWERDIKKPRGPALRLLSIIEKNGLAAIAQTHCLYSDTISHKR